MLIKIVRESDICGGGESRVVCPRCGKTSHWKCRDCGHCGYTFNSK